MKVVSFQIGAIACAIVSWQSWTTSAQGLIVFANRVAGGHDAPVVFAWDPLRGPGPGYTAQLYGGAPGRPAGSLEPLFPTTTFRDENPISERYVREVIIEVPGIPPGEFASLLMRVYNGQDWNSSTIRGESHLFTEFLGGGDFPPTNLDGLDYEPIVLGLVPEPRALVMGMAGFGVLWFLRQKRLVAAEKVRHQNPN